MKHILIVGAGIGGLSAALFLKQQGYEVTVLEAAAEAGGLAREENIQGMRFDAGPYILLDKPGLDWAFSQLGMNAEKELDLQLIQHIYEVNDHIHFHHDINRTAQGFEEQWKGQGEHYRHYIDHLFHLHQRLNPYTYSSRPSPWKIIQNRDWKLIPFLLNNLRRILDQHQLQPELQESIGIWTHIAAQSLEKAPAPMAMVPALFHRIGSYYPARGMGSIAHSLINEVKNRGIELKLNYPVKSILSTGKKVSGVEGSDGQVWQADAVMCNMSAIGAHRLIPQAVPKSYRRYLDGLPLQSPGISAYLRVKTQTEGPYLRFRTGLNKVRSLAFVNPGSLLPKNTEWQQARLVAPLPYDLAREMNEKEQHDLLKQFIDQNWWKDQISDVEVLHLRSTHDWGSTFHLHQNSMNPVMTAAFMRKGRLPHKSPYLKNLYFCGSSTHPGQWISFCCISGILASRQIIQDA